MGSEFKRCLLCCKIFKLMHNFFILCNFHKPLKSPSHVSTIKDSFFFFIIAACFLCTFEELFELFSYNPCTCLGLVFLHSSTHPPAFHLGPFAGLCYCLLGQDFRSRIHYGLSYREGSGFPPLFNLRSHPPSHTKP